eukprot:SAG11_NODE_15051_length_590_cov_1.723014_1_plen_26_part_10
MMEMPALAKIEVPLLPPGHHGQGASA